MGEPAKMILMTEGELRAIVRDSVGEAVRAALGERAEPPSEWMTLDQAAAYLSFHPNYVRRLSSLGKIPSHRLGKSYRFRRAELDECIAARAR